MMTTPIQAISPPQLLYDCDFLQWTEAMIFHLQNRNFNQLDIDNLIEEIDGLGKSQKNAFKGQIRALMEHIMKRCYVDMPLEYRSWERTIRNIRRLQRVTVNPNSPNIPAAVVMKVKH